MVGLLIVTHLDFGKSLLATAENILGKQSDCMVLSVDISQEIDQIVENIQSCIDELGSGDGVLILTDMFGGTPTNLSLSILESGKLEVLTGANLPMLLKIFNSRELPLNELAMEAKSAGQQGIVVAGEILKQKIVNE